MKRRIVIFVLLLGLIVTPVKAAPIRWVDFGGPYESLKYAMDADIHHKLPILLWTNLFVLQLC